MERKTTLSLMFSLCAFVFSGMLFTSYLPDVSHAGRSSGSALLAAAVTEGYCGNGVLDAGEDCDDRNRKPGDHCSPDCKAEYCGDGVVTPPEECDDRNTQDNDGCTAQCKFEYCSDNIQQDNEECDDGNIMNFDGCDSNCIEEAPACGNGRVEAGEQCDDANQHNVDACLNTCVNATCGDGYVWLTREQCDDGNSVDDDDCTNACALRVTPPADGIYILDNSDPRFFVIHKNNFQDHGNDMTVGDNNAYGGGYHSLLNVQMVGWKYGGMLGTPEYRTLPGGTYDVYATWIPSGGYTSAIYTTQMTLVTPTGGHSAIVASLGNPVNQAVAPSGATFRDHTWQHIGSVTFEGDREAQVMAKPYVSNGRYAADAVAFKARMPIVTSSSASSAQSSLQSSSFSSTGVSSSAISSVAPISITNLAISSSLETITFNFSRNPGTDHEIRFEIHRNPSITMLGGGAVGTQGDPSVITGFNAQLNSHGAGTYRVDFAVCPRPPVNQAPDIDDTCGPRVSRTVNYGTTSSAASSVSSVSSVTTGRAICGNGVKEGSEQCDDGNRYNQDGCNVECRIDTPLRPLSGVCSPCSECDRTSAGCYVYWGNDPAVLRGIANPTCRQSPSTYHATSYGWTTCRQPPVYGNGRLEGQEQCDDGNTVNGDGCGAYGNRESISYCPSCEGIVCPARQYCHVTTNGNPTCLSINTNSIWYRCRDCGNGRLDAGEECDDGNTVNGDACTNECTRAKCGDGVIWNGHEYCDDGNTNNGDGCGSTCQDCACQPACAYGQSCFVSLVGNAPHCGAPTPTGTVSGGYYDICPVCGNGAREKNEVCDNGTLNGTPNRCNTTCNGYTAGVCGNGVREAGEQCDDGNRSNNDSCTNVCKYAACGDGYVRTDVEQCDDGNQMQGDGCSLCRLDGASSSSASWMTGPPTTCPCSPACVSSQSCYVSTSGRAVCSTPGLQVSGWTECRGGSSGNGNICPTPPSCVAPNSACRYSNFVYNSNGCLISCGVLMCTGTTQSTANVCDQCSRITCTSGQSCYANSNTARTPVCSAPNIPNVSASGWTECGQTTKKTTTTTQTRAAAGVCGQCNSVTTCTSSQSCYANSNTGKKPVCAPKNIPGVSAYGWTECQ